MECGGRMVLLCAAFTGAAALLFARSVGAFSGLYLLTIVTLLFIAGGWLQAKEPA
jgi:hypothetical protein